MAKKRGAGKHRHIKHSSRPKRAKAAHKAVGKAKINPQKNPVENPAVENANESKGFKSFFSKIFGHDSSSQSSQKDEEHISAKVEEFRKHEEAELQQLEKEVKSLEYEREAKQPAKSSVPLWFYIASIFAAFIFTMYISIFATIHFESIDYMKITMVFLFISIVSYFLISAAYFISEKKIGHSVPAFLFFAGLSAIMVYAFRAVDTSNLVRFSIIYTIIVAAISAYILAVKRR